MRLIMTVILIAVFGWCGYWWVGASGVEKGAAAWLENQRGDGWVAEAAEVSTGGFPYRFDTTVTGLELADPDTGLAWSIPEFQVLALAYQPNHVIAIWPQAHVVQTPFEKIEIISDDMRASAVVAPEANLTLQRANMVFTGLGLTSSQGWVAAMDQGALATRQTAVLENGHEIGLSATGFRPSETLRRRLDPSGLLPEVMEVLTIDAQIGFDAPWDRFAVEDRRPQVTQINLKLLSAVWGDLDLKAAGDATVDAEGYPSGEITIKATNWREMLDVGVAAGWIPENLTGVLESALGALAGLSGNPKTLDAPLTFSNRRIFFGPVPIGPAPILKIR